MKTFTHAVAASMLGIALLVHAGPARADTVNTTLNTLLPGGANAAGITIGDKRYSDFTFSPTGDTPPAAGNVGVSLVSDDAANQYQIRFNFALDPLDATAGQRTDVVIGYKVSVLGNQLINRVGLGFDGTVTGGNGNAFASVVETVLSATRGVPVSPAFPGQDQVEISVVSGGNSTFNLDVFPTQQLEFRKDILVSSAAGGGRVNINTVDNFVYQVPEPSSAFALVGAAGLLLARRRAPAH
jgi:hypothetical protein